MAITPSERRVILHVIDALSVGGAQELIILLADKTPKSAYRTLVCVLQPDIAVKSRIEAKGASVYCLGRRRPSILSLGEFFFYFYKNIRDIVSLCRREGVDAVHCHLSDAEFIGILAGWVYKANRVISTVHYPALLPERKNYDLRNYLRIGAMRLLYCLADAVVAVSSDVAEKLKTVFCLDPSKITLIINGIDVEKIHSALPNPEKLPSLGAMPGQRLVTAVGRLMPPKGHRSLVEAMPHLKRKFGNLKLLLAGDGDLRESLESLSRRLDVQDTVNFLGSRDDVHDILALTEVFVLPSVSEGTSLALLEAMAAEKPIVATDIPGNRTVLEHERNCLLVPPDDPGKLADSVAFLLDHPDVAARYGKQAYQDVHRQFNIAQTVDRYIALWK
ncbi:MAG: glycosyltransferase family 4 protein [Syntrophaceae bacterium]|nr:glycosyltransferase family 4 protein [Syntrophaceae bacterium]